WVMMRIISSLILIPRSHHEVAAWYSMQEVSHIIAACRHHFFASIHLIRSYGLCCCLLYHLCHFLIIGTGWSASIGKLCFAGGSHGMCHAICQFLNTP